MALSSALNNALSGLRYTSEATSLTSSNVANAANGDYVRKRLQPVAQSSGGEIGGVARGNVTRELDKYVQRQLMTERSNSAYANQRAETLGRLDRAFGEPGSDNALDTTINEFNAALAALESSPDSHSARTAVIDRGNELAQQLRSLSDTVQGLRSETEQQLDDAVERANEILGDLDQVNDRIAGMSPNDPGRATLLDQRDALALELSSYMDIRTSVDSSDRMQIYTGNGLTLLGGDAARLSFDGQGELTADSVYSSDPSQRSVGTISMRNGNGSIDLVAAGAFKSGKIGALLELRDTTLPAAQDQLDQIAVGLARSLGTYDDTTSVSTGAAGPSEGYDLGLGPNGLSDGDEITMTLTANGVTQSFTFKRVDDPGATVDGSLTAAAGDQVVRLTGSDSSAHAAQIQSAIDAWSQSVGAPAGAFSVSTSGQTMRVLADPASGEVNGARAASTALSTTEGGAPLPFFVDGGSDSVYTGKVTANGSQTRGFASRIEINSDVANDPSTLTIMSTNPRTLDGDSTRASFLSKGLNSSTTFAAAGGLGTSDNPYEGSVLSYTRSVIERQTGQASAANRLAESQDLVLSQLQSRYESTSAVNIDEEMSILVQLQNAYGANARVMSTVREMFDTLMQM